MGKYDRKVKNILSLTVWTLLCTAASEDQIDEQKMKDISEMLHPKVGGKHRKRGGRSDAAEMREVLSDWYEIGGLCDLDHKDALGKLVNIIEDATVNLRPLSKELRELMSKSEENQNSPPAKSNRRTVDSGRQGDNEETLLLTDNKDISADTYQTGSINTVSDL